MDVMDIVIACMAFSLVLVVAALVASFFYCLIKIGQYEEKWDD